MTNIGIDHALLTSLGMTTDEAHRWLEKTTMLRQSCGCETGAGFMAAMLLLYPLLWYWTLNAYLTIWLALLIGLAAVIVAGGVGKLIGLLLVRIQIGIRVRDIRLRLRETSQP